MVGDGGLVLRVGIGGRTNVLHSMLLTVYVLKIKMVLPYLHYFRFVSIYNLLDKYC